MACLAEGPAGDAVGSAEFLQGSEADAELRGHGPLGHVKVFGALFELEFFGCRHLIVFIKEIYRKIAGRRINEKPWESMAFVSC